MADIPIDPFAVARTASGLVSGAYDGENVPLLLRYRDLREAAADWRRFSNDAPARLTLPDESAVRALRQLPIETDPPLHGAYRALVHDFFRRPLQEAYGARIAGLVGEAVEAASARESCDVAADFATPLQSRALALLLGLPQSDAEEWIGWGAHAFKSGGRADADRARRLEDHVERLIDRALAAPGEDIASRLLAADFQDRKLTRAEIAGFLHVAFAGGRDTVINAICGVIDHLASRPDDLAALRRDPALIATAAEEFVRYISPLTHIGRVCREATEVAGHIRAEGERIGLCFASANFDEAVFEAPHEVRLSRSPNPHVAYGSGPHACLGSTHARVLLRALLRELADRIDRLAPIESRRGERDIAGLRRAHGYEALRVRFTPRAS